MGAYLGEIRLFALPFVPHNWLPCDGSLQPVLLYPPLGQLLGNRYGGDGATTFGVPDLRGRVPLCQGTDRWGNVYALGATGGVERVALTGPQVPSHSHAVVAITQPGPYVSPIGTYPAAAGPDSEPTPVTPAIYGSGGPQTPLAPLSVAYSPGGAPHGNMQPSIVLIYCIAAAGTWPIVSR